MQLRQDCKIYSPGQNIWNKTEKSSKAGQDFCMFFDCHCQSLISGTETGRWPMSPPKFKIF